MPLRVGAIPLLGRLLPLNHGIAHGIAENLAENLRKFRCLTQPLMFEWE
jgi:hypothetical protein